MKKTLIIALGTAAVAAMALPAAADHTIAGYARTNFVYELFGDPNVSGPGIWGYQNTAIGQNDDAKGDSVINERIRARWQNNINEFVSVVLFGEVDTDWGQAGKGPGNGGKQGADGVNLEIKHAYMDIKIPQTPVAVRLGAQPISDNGAFSTVLMDDDMSGLRVDVKTDMATFMGAWVKLNEGDTRDKAFRNADDDSDLYILQANVEPIKGLKLMPQAWWSINQKYNLAQNFFTTSSAGSPLPLDSNKEFNVRVNEYWLGLGASYDLPMASKVSGWFLYDGGKYEGRALGDDNIDISAWAASAKIETGVVPGAKFGLRALYFPKQSDDNDSKRTFLLPPNTNNGGAEFPDEGSLIFLADLLMTNTSTGRVALVDAAATGMGLTGAVLSGSYTPPSLPLLYVKASVGYYMALTDENDDSTDYRDPINAQRAAGEDRGGKDLGTELAGAVGYKIAEKVDVQLRGGYAWLGKFYDGTNQVGDDPKNIYKVGVTVNIPY